MRRRDLLAKLGGVVIAWALSVTANAQPAVRMYRLGILRPTAPGLTIVSTRVLVINCQWADEAVPQWSIAAAQAMADRARAWYLADSYGKVVLDFTVTPFTRLANKSTDATPFFPAQDADKAIYLTTRNQSAPGKGYCYGPTLMWVNCMGSDYAPFAMIHELGHSFGLSHPYMIDFGAKVGNVMTLPALDVHTGGNLTEHYDGSTSMGYAATFAQFSAPEKEEMGWLVPTIYDGADRTYTLRPLSDVPDALRINCTSFVASSSRVYWIENRTDTIGENGIQVRIAGDFGLSPRAPGHLKGSLQVGDRLTDGTITIDVTAANTVRVRRAAAAQTPTLTGNAMTLATP